MGLLDEFLKDYRGEENPAAKLSPLSPKGALTNVTNTQPIENISKNQSTNAQNKTCGPENDGSGSTKNLCSSNNLGERAKNVTFVACAREYESANLPPFYQEKAPSGPPPVSSLTRASDKGDKPDCETCPACGHWDGYTPWKMRPGLYCFGFAYFKGKAAKPVPITEAQKTNSKKGEAELRGSNAQQLFLNDSEQSFSAAEPQGQRQAHPKTDAAD